MLIVNFTFITLVYRFLGKSGLYGWIAMAGVIANIQVLKTIELFGFVATLGNIVYATSFLATDILSENYGKEDARKGVFIGFITILAATVVMQIALQFTPHESDFSQEALTTIFAFFPRLVFASLTAYLASQLHDVWAFDFWRRKFPNHLFLRNNMSTLVSQFLDSAIFCTLAFWGIYDFSTFINILFTTYFIKALVAILDTPFIYLAARIRVKHPEID